MNEKPPYDLSTTLLTGYIALVTALDKRGVLSAADVANEIGNTLDFRRSQGLETAEENPLLEMLYKMVLGIEQNQSEIAALRAALEAAKRDKP